MSCMPEESGVQDSGECFTASFEEVFSQSLFAWKSGEKVSINGFIYKTNEGGELASFVPEEESVPESVEFIAVFPDEISRYGKGIKAVLPQVIHSDGDNSLPRECRVSIAKSSSRSLTFRNVLSYVSVDILADDINRITLTANGNEFLSGAFSVDYSDKNPTVFVADGENSISVVKGDGSCFNKDDRIYFATLPVTLKSGFTFSAYSGKNSNKVWEVRISEKTTLSIGHSIHLGEFYYDSSSGVGRLDYSDNIKVLFNCDSHLNEPVSELIFGSYSEMHGGDLIPGICEQYIVNPSFERWESDGDNGESKNELLLTGSDAVAEDPDVAYPWEKRLLSGNTDFKRTEEERFNTSSSQKITVISAASSALIQRIALPLYRTDRYKLKFYAKTIGDVKIRASFHGVGANESAVLSADVFAPALSENRWQMYEHEFSLSSSTSTFNNRHRQYNLWLEVSGDGTIYIDQVTIFPSDCIEGIFNPETIAYFKKYNIKAVRWPGGNYTSGYNWKNGIGQWTDRPCLKNRAWGGLDPNYLGTDEFMRFCELAEVEPIIGVGYNKTLISEQDIADWVEYCNGSVSSEYGAKRAANGHPEPYKVKYWGIGNEVYGSYQLGNVSASSYAGGLSSIASKMRSVDPDVVVIASGRGVHNHYRGAYSGWTESVASSASFDVLDCHLYVYGHEKSASISLSGEGFFRIYAAASRNLRDFLEEMRTLIPGRKIALLEWGILPKLSGKNNPTPQRQTFANLLLSACQYHEMIRNSDIVQMAAMHNFSFYVAPHKLHSEPVNVRTELFKEMSVMGGGYNLIIDEECFPTYDQTVDMLDVGIRNDVPEIDMVAVLKGDYVYVSCVNKNPEKEYVAELNLIGESVGHMEGRTYTSSRPYDRSLWGDQVVTTVAPIAFTQSGELVLPPLSYSMLKIQLR